MNPICQVRARWKTEYHTGCCSGKEKHKSRHTHVYAHTRTHADTPPPLSGSFLGVSLLLSWQLGGWIYWTAHPFTKWEHSSCSTGTQACLAHLHPRVWPIWVTVLAKCFLFLWLLLPSGFVRTPLELWNPTRNMLCWQTWSDRHRVCGTEAMLSFRGPCGCWSSWVSHSLL